MLKLRKYEKNIISYIFIMAGNDFFIEGKLLKKYDTQQVTATFSKRELVVEVPGTYVQYVKFNIR